MFQRLDLDLLDIAGFSWDIDGTELCVWDGPCGCHLTAVDLDGKSTGMLKFGSNVVTVEWGDHLLCAACVDNSVSIILVIKYKCSLYT